MDESAFRAARGAIDRQPCVFEKALLARCADCGLAARHALAEREAIGCGSPVARANCATLLGLLRERCAFALKIGRRDGPVAARDDDAAAVRRPRRARARDRRR